MLVTALIGAGPSPQQEDKAGDAALMRISTTAQRSFIFATTRDDKSILLIGPNRIAARALLRDHWAFTMKTDSLCLSPVFRCYISMSQTLIYTSFAFYPFLGGSGIARVSSQSVVGTGS